MLRYRPGERWPLLVAAVRDEFADRGFDPPAAHWTGAYAGLVGGRDRVAGGTWLAVDPTAGAFAALLNGVYAPPPPTVRHSRGDLPLRALRGDLPDPADLPGYDRFHLVHGSSAGVRVWSWDTMALTRRVLGPGDHIVVNHGPDAPDDPLVPWFAPLLAGCATPEPRPGPPAAEAWGGWTDLLRGGGLAEDDPRALLVRRPVGERVFASTSAALISLGGPSPRFDFTLDPRDPAGWRQVPLAP
jgi:hypothetical protein